MVCLSVITQPECGLAWQEPSPFNHPSHWKKRLSRTSGEAESECCMGSSTAPKVTVRRRMVRGKNRPAAGRAGHTPPGAQAAVVNCGFQPGRSYGMMAAGGKRGARNGERGMWKPEDGKRGEWECTLLFPVRDEFSAKYYKTWNPFLRPTPGPVLAKRISWLAILCLV